MRLARPHTPSRRARGALALAIGALLVLSGCGGGGSNGKPIPLDPARQMLSLIGQADREAQQGTCNGAADKAKRAGDVAANLPSSVSNDVRQGVADGIERLKSLISSQCQPPQKTHTQTSTTDTTATTQSQTTTSQTQTTESQTTPTTTTGTSTTTPSTTGTSTTTTSTTGTGTGGNGGTPPPPPGNGNGQ